MCLDPTNVVNMVSINLLLIERGKHSPIRIDEQYVQQKAAYTYVQCHTYGTTQNIVVLRERLKFAMPVSSRLGVHN